LAKTLGLNDAADILYQTLQEEEQTDKKLTKIAESGVNRKANREPVEA
jgi:ferritin-like metal-binding protein YciE